MNENICKYGDSKTAFLCIENSDILHLAWMLSDNSILSFEHIPVNSPASIYTIDSIDEYIENISESSIILNYYDNIKNDFIKLKLFSYIINNKISKLYLEENNNYIKIKKVDLLNEECIISTFDENGNYIREDEITFSDIIKLYIYNLELD